MNTFKFNVKDLICQDKTLRAECSQMKSCHEETFVICDIVRFLMIYLNSGVPHNEWNKF